MSDFLAKPLCKPAMVAAILRALETLPPAGSAGPVVAAQLARAD